MTIAAFILDTTSTTAESVIDYGFRGGVIAVLAWLGKKYLATQEKQASAIEQLTVEVKKALSRGVCPHGHAEEDAQ